MEIDDSIKSIVDAITTKIMADVEKTVRISIDTALNERLNSPDIDTKLEKLAVLRINAFVENYKFDMASIQKRIEDAGVVIANSVAKNADKAVAEALQVHIRQLAVADRFNEALKAHLNSALKEFNFPDNSIPGAAIRADEIIISSDNIKGGILEKFTSTGVDDRATACQVTILDSHTVFENQLLSAGLLVKGNAEVDGDVTITGDLNITGTLPEDSLAFKQIVDSSRAAIKQDLNADFFRGFSDQVFDRIREDGIDVHKLSLHGKPLVNENILSPTITDSNLRKVGILNDLQVKGETYLHETVYVGTKRLGVNTLDPSAALAVWDEEVEVTVGKQSKDTAQISAPRNQRLVLSSNNKSNLTLTPDGAVEVKQIKMPGISISSADAPPSRAGDRGEIVFNSNPSVGGPLGWVCLGAANWANFGIID